MDAIPHSRVATAFFDTRNAADKAYDSLIGAGFPANAVSLTDAAEARASTSKETGFWTSLTDMFMPEEDRHSYSEGLRRGGSVITVQTDDAKYERAIDILDAAGAVDLDERESSWEDEGWKRYSPDAAGSGAAIAAAGVAGGTSEVLDASSPMVSPITESVPPTRATIPVGSNADIARSSPASMGKPDAIPVYEEQLRVGKRDITHGRVRVRSYVIETPVSEQVNLRSERVEIERRPVDRVVTADEAVFRERVIEAEEHSEEAVVSKEARIKEEITLRKTADERTETVSDNVRSTKVDVEDERAEARSPAKEI